MGKREQLIYILNFGDEFNIYEGDVETFRWMVNYGIPYSGLKLGGGNLGVALISLTTIAFLAKCYVILNHKTTYTSFAKDRKKNGGELTYADIDETAAFVQMVKDFDNLWGYTEEEVREFWKRVRHKLVHSAYPKATIYPPNFHEEPNRPFSISDTGHFDVFSDHLWSKYKEFKCIIVEKLEQGDFKDEMIEKTLQFISGEE